MTHDDENNSGPKVKQAIPEGYKVIPPEGGWGWVVAGASLLITIMLSIPVLSFGILLKDIQSNLNLSTSAASWTASVSLAVSQITSPVATICIHNFSCRKTAFFGGLILSCGLIMSSFAKDISLLLIGYGFLAGIGSGFSRISCLVVGSQYFEKNFSIFAGIIYSGFSMGRVIFSPVTEIISIEYGYKNTLFLIGGLCLNVCVGALLFEPVKKHFALQKIGNEIGSNLEKVITSDPELESLNSKCNGEVKKSCDIADVSNKNDVKTLSKSSSANGTVVVCQGKEEPEVEKLLKTSHSNTQHGATETDSTKELVEIKTPSSQEQQQHVSNNKNLHRKKSYKCLKALRNSIDISLLKEQIFYIVCASSILNYLTIMYANVFLVPLCLEKGLSPIQASLVVSAKSGVEVMGRLGGPWVQRFIKQDAVLLYIIICIAVSVCFLVQALAFGFIPFIIFAILTGALAGANVVLGVDVAMKSVGRKRYPSTIGLCGFTQGWFALFAGPLIGLVRDVSGNFSDCYLLITTLQLFSAILWSVRYFRIRYRSSKPTV